MTTYIAGPMTGLPEYNFPAFHAAAARLRAEGTEVVNPADNAEGDTSQPWAFYMRLALAGLLRCDAIAMLPGWERSRGARIEHNLALDLGMPVTYLSEDA